LANVPAPLWKASTAVQYHKVYVTGDSPIEDAKHQVYVYDINTDQWGQLPPSGHYYGIPHIIGGKLAIIGGCLSATKKMTNKVSTFDEDSQNWISYYPDLLSIRSKPGVVSHLEHVIVAGGGRVNDDMLTVQDDIEVLDWIENSHWRKITIKLPIPMCAFTPTISYDDLLIVGYTGTDMKRYKSAYRISVATITSNDQQQNSDVSTKWTKLTDATHWYTTVVPIPSRPVVVGGEGKIETITADIKMYDSSSETWMKIGSLSSARYAVALAAVYNNAIIVIGGCTEEDSLTKVELGQAELVH